VFKENGMRVLVLFAAAMSLAGCEALTGQANVYKLPVDRVYQKLMAAPVKPSGSGPFGTLEIQTTGTRNASVEWATNRGRVPLCAASLKSLEAERTRIDLSCRFGDSAIEGMQAKMIRNRVIEFVDATLKDRPFDSESAKLAVVAASWPADPAAHGSMGTAAAEALEMQRKMQEEIRRVNSARN